MAEARSLSGGGFDSLWRAFRTRVPDFAGFREPRSRYFQRERLPYLLLSARLKESVLPGLFSASFDDLEASRLFPFLDRIFTRGVRRGVRAQDLVPAEYFRMLRRFFREGERQRFVWAVRELLRGRRSSGALLEDFEAAVHPLLDRLRADRATFGRDTPVGAMLRGLSSFLLMLRDPEREIHVRTKPFRQAARLLAGREIFADECLRAEEYDFTVDLALEVAGLLQARGCPPADLLDVESFLVLALDGSYARTRFPAPQGKTRPSRLARGA